MADFCSAVDIPEFTVRNVKVEAEKLEGRGDALSARASSLAEAMKKETSDASAGIYQCYRDNLTAKRVEVAAQFDVGIGQLDGAIEALKAGGANPSSIQSDAGPVDMLKQRDDLIAQRDVSLKQIDDALAQLTLQQKALTEKIIA
ncbi:hypothetical protein [Novosphingobium decolorationis]|uniref:Uncharacterized protein n=1 Tax=Novosphingobium decolorationis TaxID=2698673 RepID=A0ABX8E6P0_9SPHN|nr:hypothetical protein [Novosphingobium decolorationis]QVM84798.1 hypothetical protein HT578_14930 [Novosphingobium decolorationis]